MVAYVIYCSRLICFKERGEEKDGGGGGGGQHHGDNTKPIEWIHLTQSLVCKTKCDVKDRRKFILPEYEYEENKERKEDGDVVHRPEHDEQLTAKVRHETN